MSKKKQSKDKVEKPVAGPEEEAPKTAAEYQCCGNVEVDFPNLCALMDVKLTPAVSVVSNATCYRPDGGRAAAEDIHSEWARPCVQVALASDDPHSPKSLKVSGWTVDEQIVSVLNKMLPSLSKLQSLQFWQARLTDRRLISLGNTLSLCPNLTVMRFEHNPLPRQSFHILLSEDSPLTHLYLRNNQIGDEGARLIGAALSTARSANGKLLSLNLAFNRIGDAGATYIAQGLRLNRTLQFLSLSNNQIGDSGAAQLVSVLSEFPLIHEELVERRRLLLEKLQTLSPGADADQSPPDQLPSVSSCTSLSTSKRESKATGKKKEALRKSERQTANKENVASVKKPADQSVRQTKGSKPAGKLKQMSAQEQGETVDVLHPLLDPALQYRDEAYILPGNKTLVSLNLAGNKITEQALPLLLKSLETQTEDKGLMRLCLERNNFPPDCESYVMIKNLMALRDPLHKNVSEQIEEKGLGVHPA